MPFGMNVQIAGSSPLEHSLEDGRYRIGSRPECEIHIDFEEVSAVAAQLDVRGEAVFIRGRVIRHRRKSMPSVAGRRFKLR